MEFAGLGAADLDHGQQVVTAVRRWLRLHDRASGLPGEIRSINGITRSRRCIAGDVRAVHALLEPAQVLHARHDFLSRVAAFLEIYAADKFEIGHLWHELLVR